MIQYAEPSRFHLKRRRLLDAPAGACHRARRRRDPVAGM